MNLLFLLIGAILVILIALVALGRVVAATSGKSRPAVYELPDAVEWIAERLPEEVTARISFDDVARILSWHLDWFGDSGLASRYGEELAGDGMSGEATVAVEDAAVDAVVARSLAANGPEPVDVVCVLDLQMKYLRAIGALVEEPDADGDADGDHR